jgi:hypothetical protein
LMIWKTHKSRLRKEGCLNRNGSRSSRNDTYRRDYTLDSPLEFSSNPNPTFWNAPKFVQHLEYSLQIIEIA